jgi:CDK-activating kinase assembly factor MAT1
MCSTCVDRIFTSGPTSCPVPYCGKTLRKKGFHKAFFGDLKIEREVDIRKRVGEIFNRRQDEFETLKDWNNYLEEVEVLVFEIVNGTKEERARAEERLQQYAKNNMADIEDNRRIGIEEAERERRREKAEKEEARRRRLEMLKQEEESKMDVERNKMEVLERLATTNEDARKITMQANRVVLKKSSAMRTTGTDTNTNGNGNNGALDGGLTLRGLRKKEAPVAEKPYDPFGGINLSPSRFVLQDDYESEWLAGAKTDPRHTAGGYSLHEYYARTMFEAFSGLGVFIEDEVMIQAQPAASAPGTAFTMPIVTHKVKQEYKIEQDDVF